jgi:hypothetical protein
MAKVIVFHYIEQGRVPKSSKKELEDAMKKFCDVLKDYPDVKFNGTYVNEDGVGLAERAGIRPEFTEIDWLDNRGEITIF